MQSDSIQDSTRYVVSATHHGSILPGKRLEMSRDVFLLPGADIRGGIWCGSLTVDGPPVAVQDAVYCKGAVVIRDNRGATMPGPAIVADQVPDITFGSPITAGDSIVIERPRGRVRFLSDIYTNQLNITNAFIYGNVFASRAIIRDSIVLGGVFCQGHVLIERSMVSTFEARQVSVGAGTYLFMPFALARESISLQEPVRVFTFYSMRQKLEGQGSGNLVLLSNDDITTLRWERPNGGADGKTEVEEVKCLSMTERILDTVPVQEHFVFNRRLIEALALGKNMDPQSPAASAQVPQQDLETQLWEFLRGGPEQAGTRSTTTIKALFDRIQRGTG